MWNISLCCRSTSFCDEFHGLCLEYRSGAPAGMFLLGAACAAAALLLPQQQQLGHRNPGSINVRRITMVSLVAVPCAFLLPGAAMAMAIDVDGALLSTRNLLLLLVAGAFGALVPYLGSLASPPSTRGLTCKTGLGVPLPYRGTRKCAYLDYNATSPIFSEVSREMLPFIGECFGNPSSTHALGRSCKAAVDKARARVAALLDCTPAEIVFVASGSEADNHAILGSLALYAEANPSSGDGSLASKPHVVSSTVEHPAVSKCLDHMVSEGKVEVTYVGVDGEGRVSCKEVVEALRAETALVTIMHSNNEVGTLQPIKEIAEACRGRGIFCHTDAAQSIGKVSVQVSDLGVDLLTIVGHKFGAPKGVAALYVRDGVALPPMVHGGGQEAGRRAGTENVLLISGMGKAAEVVNLELEQLSKHAYFLRARLLKHLEAAGLGEGVRVHGPRDPLLRLPNTLSIGIPGLQARVLLDTLSETVAASAGSACHSGGATMSGVLQAMGVDEATGLGTLRLSVGRHTTASEVDRAAAAIVLEAKNMLASSSQ